MITESDIQKINEIIASLYNAKDSPQLIIQPLLLDDLLNKLVKVTRLMKIKQLDNSSQTVNYSLLYNLYNPIVNSQPTQVITSLNNNINSYISDTNNLLISLIDDLSIESIILSTVQRVISDNSKYNALKKEADKYESLKPKIEAIASNIDNLENNVDAIINKEIELRKRKLTQSFNYNSKILSSVYYKRAQSLFIERIIYTILGLSLALCATFILIKDIDKFEGLNGIIKIFMIRFPLVGISIWSFFEVSRVTKLHDFYMDKAQIAMNIEELINTSNNDDNNVNTCGNFKFDILSKLTHSYASNQKQEINLKEDLKYLFDKLTGLIEKLTPIKN